jgi:hypothetical protein
MRSAIHDLQHNLEWKELRETIFLLNLSVVQIESSMTDGAHSVDQLIESFTSMNSALSETQDDIKAMMATDQMNREQVLAHMQKRAEIIGEKMTRAIIAFQFYDKLSQRLSHVGDGLDRLCNLIATEEKLSDETAWKSLKTQVRNRLSMEDETLLYDLIYQGIAPKEAIEQVRQKLREKAEKSGYDATGEIELF